MTIQAARIQTLNDKRIRSGRYVLYWMQQSQRAFYNHALTYATIQANQLNQALLVVFGLSDDYPEANLRHYTFMLEGLRETQATLAEKSIRMVVQRGAPAEVAIKLGRKASLIVCDRGYLKHQRAWRKTVAKNSGCQVIQVESDVVVPIEVVSNKAEYAARTIRPKIHKHLEEYLVGLKSVEVQTSSMGIQIASIDLTNPKTVLKSMPLDRQIMPVSHVFKGGTSRAQSLFDDFLQRRLSVYPQNGNQPQTDDISHMSPYLHFGQVSSLYLALMVSKTSKRQIKAQAAYIEQLIVRRELAMNFANYAPNYDSYQGLPNWAAKTLDDHKKDKRQWLYSRRQLENANTHDDYWNASMREMKATGFMHNYMRMYWGKKILEWSTTPQQAFKTILSINNKYFLDGRDANSYAGVAWIFGVHDRAWAERDIFGKVRYMAASGLERKCDIQAYIQKVNHLTSQFETIMDRHKTKKT